MTARPDRAELEVLHLQMARMRRFEEAIADLWRRGLVSGEMHVGVGEEGIAAGVTAHLQEGDALSLDYRPTPFLLGRGLDLDALLLEMLGSPDGLCGGYGGHMHLLDPDHLAYTSGIVGSPAPIALGMALSGQLLRPGAVTVSVFGDGAANQGMVMESLNLASVWQLPVVFVCKDNGWAVTTRSGELTAGTLLNRVASFEIPARRVDGRDVAAVWRDARWAVDRARSGRGPSFLLAGCRRPRGHVEDDQLVSAVHHPRELAALMPDLIRNAVTAGGTAGQKAVAAWSVTKTVGRVAADQWLTSWDPLRRSRSVLGAALADPIEERARTEVAAAVERVLVGVTT